MDVVRKMATGSAAVVLFFYMGLYVLGSMVVSSQCPADADFPVFCSETPDTAKGLALAIGALLCLGALVCAAFWMTKRRHWYHALALGVGVGACFAKPTFWAWFAAVATLVAVTAPLLSDDAVSTGAAKAVAGVGRLPSVDLRTLGSALLAGVLIAVGESRLVWSGLFDIGIDEHRLHMGTLDVRIAITVAALAVVALTAGLAGAAVISGHAGPSRGAGRATLLALLALVLGLYAGGRWHAAGLNYAGAGVAIAVAIRHDHRYQLALRIVAVVACAALAVMVFHSSLAVSILLVALAVPAADLVAECGSWTFGGS